MKVIHPSATTLLDIGAGTGLLSLMIAQKMFLETDAVEIDPESSLEASLNFGNSPWSKRLRLHCNPIQEFVPPEGRKYDLIICNPPFFSNSLTSPEQKKNLSKHENNLSIDALLSIIFSLLKDDGFAFLLLPSSRDTFESIASEAGLHLHKCMKVQQTPNHRPFRSMYCLGKQKPATVLQENIIIKNETNGYSDEFKILLKPYYLAL